MESMPTKPIARPSASDTMPRNIEAPSTDDTVTNANTINEKNSAGPNLRARSATSGANSVSKITPIVPAINEPIAAVASAGPARPFLAIVLPSRAVMIDELSPGVFIKIDVVEPPYAAP